MSIYHFVYKTTHKNGKYYFGRHSTTNINDRYFGSGVWVQGIKDKSTLSREIVVEATTIEELCELEDYYIDLHWDDPLCMNKLKSSGGWTSEESKKVQKRRLEENRHPWQTRPDGSSLTLDRTKRGENPFSRRPDGSSVAQDRTKNGDNPFSRRSDGTSVTSDRVNNGTHHWLTRPDGTNVNTDRVEKGTHPWQKRADGSSASQEAQLRKVKEGTHPWQSRLDGSNFAKDRVNNGTHNWLTRPDGTNVNTDRVEAGTHNFLKRPDGTSLTSDRVENGTHPWQTRPDGSNLAKDRVENGTHPFLELKNTVSCVDKTGKCLRIPSDKFYSQTGPKETWEWVGITSKIGKQRRFPS
jgi:hypothetical protein